LFAINLQIVTLKCVGKLPKHWKYLNNYPTMTDNEIYQRCFTRSGLGNGSFFGRAVRNDWERLVAKYHSFARSF